MTTNKKTQTITIDDTNAGRVDHVVRDLTSQSRSIVERLFDNACVKINGKPCGQTFQRVAVGDKIEVNFDPKAGIAEAKKAWDDRTFEIIHEDSWILVVDKAAGVLTLPKDKDDNRSLLDRVKLYLNHSRSGRECHVIHRLDREASGLLVFAKTAAGAKVLQAQFAEDTPKRLFTAIVNGVLTLPDGQTSGKFESWLATASNLDQYRVYTKDEGQQAITHYRPVKVRLDTTVVEIELKTARRHQLRVQLADAGHPVLGDPRYGHKKGKTQSRHRNWHKRRLALHAHQLEFLHPENGKPVSFTSPLPKAMKKFRPQPEDT